MDADNVEDGLRCPKCGHHGAAKDLLLEGTAPASKQPYYVGIREVHLRHFNVMATSPEEAKDLVANRAPEAVDLEEIEYCHELCRDTWDAYPIFED
jgi:hypothetical protein